MNLIEEQALERRDKILATVRDCIAQQGVMQLTIRDLAKACRVSVPTLYRGFGSKEALLVEAIRTFFNTDVLGARLEQTDSRGAQRLLAVIDLCGETTRAMPEYNKQLFTLFMSSDYGAQLGWDITEAITQAVRECLDDIHSDGELDRWVDRPVLAERIAAQCVVVALEFCNDDLPAESFVSTFGYSACLMLLGATTGKAQTAVRKRLRQCQKAARRQYNPRLQRTPGKPGPY